MRRISILLLLFLSFRLYGQVGVNTVLPEESAILEVKDTERGILLPRVATSARLNLQSQVNSIPSGLMLFDLSDNLFFFFNANTTPVGSVSWQALSPFYMKDLRNDFIGGNFMRTIESHASIKNINLFKNTLPASDRGRLFVDGQISVSSTGAAAPATYGIHVDGESQFGGSVTVTDKASSTGGFVGQGMVPIGSIMMWSGSPGNLPTGYRLCDGSGGTPNLSERFVIGAGGTWSVGSTGGNAKITLDVSQMPRHTHSYDINTTTSTQPGHFHNEGQHAEADFGVGFYIPNAGDRNRGRDPSDRRYYTTYAGEHSHTTSLNETDVTETFGSGLPYENRPEFYILAFIMRVN